MDWTLEPEELMGFFQTWAQRCTGPLSPTDADPRPQLRGHHLTVDREAVHRLCHRLMSRLQHASEIEDACAAIACEATSAAPIRSRTLHSRELCQINAQAAVLLCHCLTRGAGSPPMDNSRSDDIVTALTGNYMTPDQRWDTVRAIFAQQAIQIVHERPRPDPADGPIVSIGTPISAVDTDSHERSLAIADVVAEVVETAGMQSDVPGHAIRPGVFHDQLWTSRDFTSRSALTYAAGFVGVDSDHARRGMGYAVALMEAQGGAVLLLPSEVEQSGFSTVFGHRFSHREEGVYANSSEAAELTRRFLSDHQPCMVARHHRVLDDRARLDELAQQLRRRLEGIDLIALANGAMTAARAQFLTGDPIHLGHATKWELEELARLVGLPARALVGRVLSLSPQSARPMPTKQTSRREGDSTWYASFAAARQIHPGRADEWLQLLDEWMEDAVAGRTAARRTRNDAVDWVNAYRRRFG